MSSSSYSSWASMRLGLAGVGNTRTRPLVPDAYGGMVLPPQRFGSCANQRRGSDDLRIDLKTRNPPAAPSPVYSYNKVEIPKQNLAHPLFPFALACSCITSKRVHSGRRLAYKLSQREQSQSLHHLRHQAGLHASGSGTPDCPCCADTTR